MSAAPPTRLLILGAGWLGGALALDQAARGRHVAAVRRSPPLRGPKGVTWIRGDVTRAEALVLTPAFARLDVIALTIAPDDGDYGVYAAGAHAAAALAGRHGARLVVYTSSTGVYAEESGGHVDEESPLGSSARARALAAAEEVLRRQSPAPVAILRLSGLYGPGRSPVGRYADPTRLPAGGTTITCRIRLEDAVSALRLVIDRRLPGVFNVTDDEPATALEISRWLAARHGDGPGNEIPPAHGPPATGRRISNARLRELGWVPRFPSFREGLLDLL